MCRSVKGFGTFVHIRQKKSSLSSEMPVVSLILGTTMAAASASIACFRALVSGRSGDVQERHASKRTAHVSRLGVRAAASVDVDAKSTPSETSTESTPTPYTGFVAPEVRDEIIVKLPQAGDLGSIDEREWVPQTETVSFKPLLLNVSQGYYVNLLRVKGSGVLSRHRHPGPVHGYVLKGRWNYLEHDWVAEPGSYVFEPPGETHTLVVPQGVDEMITMFNVTGALLYCDEDGNVTGAEDVFDKLEMAKKHYESVGWGAEYVDQFVR